MLLRICIAIFVFTLCSVTPAQTPRKSRGWEPIKALLASTPARRLSASRKLSIDVGDRLIVIVSTQCNDCDRMALALNKRPDADRIIAVTDDPEYAARAWSQKLSLKLRVVSVSEDTLEDFGAVLLPTLIFLRDGQPIAAREDAPRDEKDVPNLPPAPPAKAPATRRN
jgi:hypothetical protein